MATAIDSSPPSSRSPSYLQLDSIPIVDLNVLSQSELNSLSLCSADAFDFRHCDDLVVPKIDRTVFNESAGGRKQTYSRLRLAPRQPEIASPSARKKGAKRAAEEGLGRKENSERIVSVLRRLLGRGDGPTAAIEADRGAAAAIEADRGAAAAVRGRKRGRPRKDRGLVRVNEVRVSEECGDFDGDAGLEDVGGPFGEELRKRTEGLVTAAEFLGFLGGLEGQWANQRKKRKIVDAAEFGDYLPIGWKVLLGLRRKQGRVSLYCRRYISTNGQQFASWKEVASYLMSYGPLNSYTVNACSSDEMGHLPYKTTCENVLPNEASKFQANYSKEMNRDPRCSLANSHYKPDMDFVRATEGRNVEKDVIGNEIASTSSSRKKRLSSGLCSSDAAEDMGRNNLSNFDKNHGSMLTVEELNLDNKGALHSSGTWASPLNLADNGNVKEDLENCSNFPKIADSKHPCSVCIWCGVEFKHEAVKHEARFSDPVGFLCPICRDKLSVLDNGLAANPVQH